MRLITTYCCETAERVVQYYGRVELDDGTTIELGSKRDLDAAGGFFSLTKERTT